MAKKKTDDGSLRPGDKVLATIDLRDVPEGSTGTVALVNGLTWTRYWVRFDNGVSVGSLDRTHLATPAQWERKLNGTEEVASTGGGATDDAAAGDEGDGGGLATPSGTVVPQKLIDRAKAARARLAA